MNEKDLNYFFIFLFDNISSYISRKYVVKDNYFIRNRILNQKLVIFFILSNKLRTTAIEIDDFIEKIYGISKTVSKQAISKSRGKLKPDVFIDMNKDVLENIYSYANCIKYFKGYLVLACDGSIVDLPQDKNVRKAFDIPDNTEFTNYWERGRLSCFVDVNLDFILNTKLVSKVKSEVELAIGQIKELNKIINLKNTITIYDRGYESLELMVNSIKLDTKFIIRIRKTTYEKQRIKIGNDGIIKINVNKSKTNNFKNPELIRYAFGLKRVKLRIITVKLSNGEIEYLVTNIFDKNFTTEDFKELYNQRWRIETNYDHLKNKLKIEKFSGTRKIIILQDIYSQILRYNLAITLKIDARKRIKRIPKPKSKSNYDINFNYVIGQTVNKMLLLLTKPLKEKERLIDIIIYKTSKNLSTQSKDPFPTSKRTKKDVTRKYSQNIKSSF